MTIIKNERFLSFAIPRQLILVMSLNLILVFLEFFGNAISRELIKTK